MKCRELENHFFLEFILLVRIAAVWRVKYLGNQELISDNLNVFGYASFIPCLHKLKINMDKMLQKSSQLLTLATWMIVTSNSYATITYFLFLKRNVFTMI